MDSAFRLGLILGIIGERPISSQEELVAALDRQGVHVSQATVSRDIRRLGLVKAPLASGGSRYAPADQIVSATQRDAERAVRQYVTGFGVGEALIVVKTRSGHASALADILDRARWPELVGTVAGDDTILLILRNEADRERILELFAALPES